MNYLVIGNDELGESVGVRVRCDRCNEWHDVTSWSNNLLQSVRCGDSTYVVGIHGHRIRPDAERARRKRMAEEQRLAPLAPEMLALLRRVANCDDRAGDLRAEIIAIVERADDAEEGGA